MTVHDEFRSTHDRRSLLAPTANPDPSHDYLSTLTCDAIHQRIGKLNLTIRYIPDRLILTQNSLDTYLTAFNGLDLNTVEQATLILLDDINDSLIPRWIEVSVTDDNMSDSTPMFGHSATVEDRQPGWDNPRLIARLGPL